MDDTVPKTVYVQEGTARRSESMQQSSATPKNRIGLQMIIACSHSSSQCLLVSTVFGTVSSLHPTSFLMIFILVSPIFYPGLALTVACSEMSYVNACYTYNVRIRTCVLCARIKRKLWRVGPLHAINNKMVSVKRKSPQWTWILLSEGQILPYYTKDTSRTKIWPSHVKIMVFRPLIWAVELKKKKMEKIAVWPTSVYTASDGF